MKLKCNFENIDMQDEIISVPVGQDANKIQGVLKLNQSGAEIIDILKDNVTIEQIVDKLSAQYRDDKGTLTTYVMTFIDKLKSNGLIEE